MNLATGARVTPRMKQVLLARLTDTCTIDAPSFTADAYGGRTVSATASTLNVPCLAQPMNAGDQRSHEGILKARQGYRVMLAAGTAVALKNTITVNSVVLEVVALDNPLSGEPIRRVICAKIA